MRKQPSTRRQPRHAGRAALVSCATLLFAFSASAEIPIPDQPLIIGSRIPPNILFLLDNSGSMTWNYLPDDAPTGWRRETSVHNKIYYDPSIDYQPWVDSTGSTMSGGQNYRSAYAGTQRIPPFDTSTIDLRNETRTFYVPKDPAGDLNDQANYWRYQIHTDETIIRSERLVRTGSVRGEASRGCTDNNNNNLQWRNCTAATPAVPGRSQAQERTNFATWYSYHRTRYKVAKSSVGRAFAEIGGEYRVGYRNIFNDMPISGSVAGINWGTHPITRAKPIPVASNKGLFDDPNGVAGANNNKTAWYQRLYAETGSGSTPLREALYQAGEYFETDTSATGPWGEGRGNDQEGQFACRLNYTILTTDGYRNDGSWNRAGTIGEQDDRDGPLIESPTGATYQYKPSRPFSSSHSGNLADIAMRYWKRDLRPDLDNVVPTSPANPAFWQHMVTFGISLGAAGTLDPGKDLPALTSGAKSWPYHYGYQQGSNGGAESIDDLWHAAVNSRGSFVMANNADEFSRALRDALNEIANRDSSFSNVASNSVSLETGSRAFNASYVTGTWTGALTARAITAEGVSATPSWVSSLPAWNTRKIFTSHDGAGISFPSGDQLARLGRSGGATNYPVTAENNARYIRGDASNEASEGGLLRNRGTKLGDIIGSSPAYVKETNTLYVGANDGMLHAFDATNGLELFGYVPGIIDFGHLSTLSRGDYDHKFFVDGPVVVSDRAQTGGRNILIGSLGRGGRGLYALDVTTPATAAADSTFKWERSDTPEGHLGMVLGRPFFANVASRASTVAVVGNGINSTHHRAVLLVLDAASGEVIAEIDTGAGSADAPNGLSAPTGVYGADGRTLSYVYAGDMRGNVWKFDLTAETSADWEATLLFTATNEAEDVQPISGALTLATHPVTRKRWIFFGTGRYLTADDVSSSGAGVQSMYGFMDEDELLTHDDLTQRSIDLTGEFVDGYPVRAFQSSAALPSGSKGWYINLPESGERIIQDAQLVSSFLVTASMIPSGNACNPDGIGYLNAFNAFTGTSASGSYFDLDGDGRTDDSTIGDSGRPVGSVNVGGGMPTLPNLLRGVLVVGGTGSGNLRSIQTSLPRWDRVSWREIRSD
ncbi:pilus assembly protein [Luteimonas sp. XNQY3]|nr:PilC/PilY family type IV pilus protein [Luteimonas sp. XNQY3]MCD9005140.1 pilus assembly protein [Luteimonas sp. XNQY3]